MAERAKRDRPARYPRAKNCMKCRNVFVGELWHKFCAICVEKVATEIAAEQLKGLWRQARVVIGRATASPCACFRRVAVIAAPVFTQAAVDRALDRARNRRGPHVRSEPGAGRRRRLRGAGAVTRP